MINQEQLIKEIKYLSESIRRKHRALKLGVSEREKFLEDTFKPVIKPIMEIEKKIQTVMPLENKEDSFIEEREIQSVIPEENKEDRFIEEEEEENKTTSTIDGEKKEEEEGSSNLSILAQNIPSKSLLARKYYLKMLHAAPTSKKYHIYGARMTDNGLYIGNSIINVTPTNDIYIGGKKYKGTNGLFELIFKQEPTKYNENDLKTFKTICEETNAHRKAYSNNNPVYRNRSKKYRLIISKLFPTRLNKQVEGSGVGIKNMYDTNIIYYNNINKLVDRLRLLYEAVQAGHTGVDNEIIALTEELRSRGVIE